MHFDFLQDCQGEQHFLVKRVLFHFSRETEVEVALFYGILVVIFVSLMTLSNKEVCVKHCFKFISKLKERQFFLLILQKV